MFIDGGVIIMKSVKKRGKDGEMTIKVGTNGLKEKETTNIAKENIFELEKRDNPYEKALSKTDIDVLVNSLRSLLHEDD